VSFLAELDGAVDPFNQPAKSSTLDNLATVTAASGMNFFSGAPDEKPRVDYLTTLQYHGFSYHDV
jgi:ethanolamine ammonia-lyase large subunit